MKNRAARIAATSIGCAAAVFCAWFTLVYAVAAVGPDGTWTDVVGALAFMVAAVGCGALALGGER